MKEEKKLVVIGGGLAGCEAAWQAAERGVNVVLYEMRPEVETGAHVTGFLAELVCSNSLGSNLPDRAAGLIKNEIRRMGSLLMRAADETAVPAGGALAVDRELFAQRVTEEIEGHPNIRVVREEVKIIPEGPVVVASGPLTSAALSAEIARFSGEEHLYFFDAIAPIVSRESINMKIAFRASRYDRGEKQQGDYINCPMNKEEYSKFVDALRQAERIALKDIELELEEGVKAGAHTYFEGCLPVEIIAQRGEDSLAYGPMRPVGLTDPRTGRWPYAVVQLRQDDLANTMYNLVGFQTNLTFVEQRRVFRMIPGLEKGEFLRYGQMHRNTFIFSPKLMRTTLEFNSRGGLFFAGQITGIEGYVGNIASGLLAGWNAARVMQGEEAIEMPRETMLGALCHYIANASKADFQPMKANFGIMLPLEDDVRRNKRERARAYAERSLAVLEKKLEEING